MHQVVNVVGLCGVLVFGQDLARGSLPEAVKRKIDSLEELFRRGARVPVNRESAG
jgi:hypothetical protein